MSCRRAQCHCDIVYTKADFGKFVFLNYKLNKEVYYFPLRAPPHSSVQRQMQKSRRQWMQRLK